MIMQRFAGVMFALFVLLGLTTTAQTFTNSVFGNGGVDDPSIISMTPDSGFCIGGGGGTNTNGQDILIIRTDAFGDTLWTLRFGTSGTDYIGGLLVLNDGSVLVTGMLDAGGPGSTYRYFITKIDTAGQLLWTKKYSNTTMSGSGHSIAPFSDSSGFLVVGEISPNAMQQYEASVMKIDSSGNVIWSYLYGTNGNNEMLYDALPTADGGFMLSGVRNLNEILMMKVDSAGALVWTKTYGSTGQDYATNLCAHPGGGYVVTGCTFSFGGIGKSFLMRVNDNGDTTWCHRYGTALSTEWGRDVVVSHRGGFFMWAMSEAFSPMPDPWAIETDSAGMMQWSRVYIAAGWGDGLSCVATPDSGYATISRDDTSTPAGYNFLLMKTDIDGDAGTCDELNTPGLQYSCPFIITSLALNQQNGLAAVPDAVQISRGVQVVPYCVSTGDEPAPHAPASAEIAAYPNPFSEQLTIAADAMIERIDVYNAMGQLLISQSAQSDKAELNLAGYESGMYFVNVVTAQDNKVITVTKL